MPDNTTYPVYIPKAERARMARSEPKLYIPKAERERIAKAKREKTQHTPAKKKRPSKTASKSTSKSNLQQAAAQTTLRRRASLFAGGIAATTIGLVGFSTVQRLSHQSEPRSAASTPTVAYVAIPHTVPTHQAVAPKAKQAALTIRNSVAEAQHILSAPLSPEELHAKPFYNRMRSDPSMMRLIHSVSATTGTPKANIMAVIAAETGGKPGNPLQVTHPEFPKLINTFGGTYAEQMESHAATLHDGSALSIQKQAAELRSVTQLYEKHLHDAPDKGIPAALQKRMDRLYQNDYIRAGMQVLSNERDMAKVASVPMSDDSQKVFKTHRAMNFLGLTSIMDIFKNNYSDHQPVSGTIMRPDVARANHVDYRTEIKDMVVNLHGHAKHVLKRVKIPVSIGEFKEKQLEPWVDADKGFAGQLARDEAQRVLSSHKSTPSKALNAG